MLRAKRLRYELYLKKRDRVRVIPLGGLSEVGKNMLVIEYNDERIVIDAGLMFPRKHMLGINYVIPDISYLQDKKVSAIILTHGHEDHIGALPFIIDEIKAPIYSGELTIDFLKNKLTDADVKFDKSRFHKIKGRDKLNIGSFEIEFLKVNHSFIGCFGLAIKTPLKTIIHTGDFKFDLKPTTNDIIDIYKFAQYGENGVDLLLSDSTNVEKSGFSASETSVYEALEHTIKNASGMVIVASFASLIERIQQVVSAAKKCDKKVAFSGKSLMKYVNIATKLKYLDLYDIIIPIESIKNHPRNKIVCITTGTQGEDYSTLSLLAAARHKYIHLKENDTIVLSSSVIPGNEDDVNSMINNLYIQGVNIIDDDTTNIHASGHAHVEELKLMYRITKPKYFIPVHGETRHLIKHSKLIGDLTGDKENCFTMYNGDIFEMTKDSASIIDKLELSNIYIDGKGVGDIGDDIIKERSKLSKHGIVHAHVIYKYDNGKLVLDCDISSKGFILNSEENDNYDIINDGGALVIETLSDLIKRKKDNPSILKFEAGKVLKKFFSLKLRREPFIMISINKE